MLQAPQERCSGTIAAEDLPRGAPTPSIPLCFGISERKQNCGAVPQVTQCGPSGKYRWPAGCCPHWRGDTGLDLLIPDNSPGMPQRGRPHAQELCVLGDSGVCNGHVLTNWHTQTGAGMATRELALRERPAGCRRDRGSILRGPRRAQRSLWLREVGFALCF